MGNNVICADNNSLWFEKVLALRPQVDLAGKVNKENVDAQYRERLSEAFYSEDIERYCKEVGEFIKYCVEDVVINKFLGRKTGPGSLTGLATFYSRVPYVLGSDPGGAHYVKSVFGLDAAMVDEKSFLKGEGPLSSWLCKESECGVDGPGEELETEHFSAVFSRFLLEEKYSLVPFYNSLPVRLSLSFDIAEIISDTQQIDEVLSALLFASNEPNAQLQNIDISVSEILTLSDQQIFDKLSDLFTSLDNVDVELAQLVSKYVVEIIKIIFGKSNSGSSFFDHDRSSNELSGHFEKNRQWLKNDSTLKLSDLPGLSATFLLIPSAKRFHCFHFGLGYEEEQSSLRDGASGALVLFDSLHEPVTRDEFYGVQFLMQSCMSSLAILESELIQSHLVTENKIAEKSQFILRKLHHALAGPISVAFNRFALRYDKMVGIVQRDNAGQSKRDLSALSEVYAIMKTARSQVVSWAAFSNPEGIRDKRVATKIDLREHVAVATKVLTDSQNDNVLISLWPQSSWDVHGNLDVGLIDVLIWQLIKNAWDHVSFSGGNDPGPDGIKVKFERTGSGLDLSFSNLAPGFSEREATAINSRLAEGKIIPSNKPNGQGLGLLSCHEIMKLHEGKLEIHAVDGHFVANISMQCM